MQVTQTKHPTCLRRAWAPIPKNWRHRPRTCGNALVRQQDRSETAFHVYPRQSSLKLLQLCFTTQRKVLCRAKAPGIFPAGQKQATVPSPAFCLCADAFMLLNNSEFGEQVNQLVNNGVNLVILSDSTGGAALYDGALKLKDLLRGRADLLILDRTDICIAVGANGVLLTSQGVPVVVGRRMLQSQPALIGREAFTAEEAATAAADGANFILLRAPDGSFPSSELLQAARSMQRSGNPIPIILSSAAPSLPAQDLQTILPLSPDGLALPAPLIQQAAAACSQESSASLSPQQAAITVMSALAGTAAPQPGPTLDVASPSIVPEATAPPPPAPKPPKAKQPAAVPTTVAAPPPSASTAAPAVREVFEDVVREGSSLRRLLSEGRREELVADEKALLSRILELLKEVDPQLEGIPLLEKGVKGLDDRFLVVVVGEFNSGKSSVVNALLGARFLAEGILPTTNEITVLRYGSDPKLVSSVERKDGEVVRYLQAELLREMNVVDTPGTNVILERQQRLTEEYVPEADLVLFVMSCDRPFTESEVKFLEYITGWGKKIVFVVNKVDMLSNEQEVQEIVKFVKENAQRLLKQDDPYVWPVSSRLALRAKQEFAGTNGALNSLEDERMDSSDEWQRSRFASFERFISDFLLGTGSKGGVGEGIRLKLQNPVGVAEKLVAAAGIYLQGEIDFAEQELQAVCAVNGKMQQFSTVMAADGAAQRKAVRDLIYSAKARAETYIDRTVKVAMLSDYVMGSSPSMPSSNFEEAVGVLYGDLCMALQKHQKFLEENCEAQLRLYSEFVRPKDETAGLNGGPAPTPSLAVQPSWTVGGSNALATSSSSALATVSEFDVRAVGMLLEEEMREAVVGTAGTAAGASGLGLLATSMVANTLEDLLLLGVAGLASYITVLNLPLKRAEIKEKVAGRAERFAKAVEERMEAELQAAVSDCVERVSRMVEPIQTSRALTVFKLTKLEEARADLATQLTALQRKIALLE